MQRNTVSDFPPQNLPGLKKLLPGVYTDDNGDTESLFIRVPEFMAANNLSDTPQTRRATLETIVEALRGSFPRLPVYLCEVGDTPAPHAPYPAYCVHGVDNWTYCYTCGGDQSDPDGDDITPAASSEDRCEFCHVLLWQGSGIGCALPLCHAPDRFVAEVTA